MGRVIHGACTTVGVFAGLVLGNSDSALAMSGAGTEAALGSMLPLWSVIPFALLLIAIALFPLTFEHWWEKNRNRALVSLLLGVPTALYMCIYDFHVVLHAVHEYISFIVLLGALYIISGGLVLRGDIAATPRVNTLFLAIGSVLANFIGTTGASMLLIRPMLRTNAQRTHTRHIPIFFIFLVANMGGMLTPLGDPPLFLGYLRGVPFFWTLRLFPIWVVGIGIMLIAFYLLDRFLYAKETLGSRISDDRERQPLALAGGLNFLFLAGVIGTVFLPTPWREIGMAAMALLSMRLTSKGLRVENRFTFAPIVEVAVVFIGIFLSMIPALEILRARGGELGLTSAWHFFWATGLLSSFLDNAPTYVSFLSLAQGMSLANEVVGIPHQLLMAIGAGAVFMGANSYIGNGPNFMVKAIADEADIPMPNFFSYMAISALCLWPVFGVVTYLFFL